MTSVYWIHHKDHADMFSQGYIGISDRLNRRYWEHQFRSGNNYLKNAINKYGWDNLVKEVVLISDEKYCLDIESKLRPTRQIGWNIASGGGKPPIFTKTGWTHTPEAKEKNRQAHLGKVTSEETKKKLSEIGKTVANSGQFKKGQISPMKGKKRPKDAVEAHRILMTGRKITEEHKAKISKGLLGRVVTEETRKKISIGNKNRSLIKCDHCDKMGDIGSMTRWHFNNCKHKEAICL